MATEKRLVYAEEVEELIAGMDSLPWEEEVETLVNSLTTVDAVEVVHGEWSIIEDDYDDATILECSVCEMSFHFEEYDGLLPQAQTYHYCPNCGSKMRGSEE